MSGRTGRRLFARAAAATSLLSAASASVAEKRMDNPLKHFADQIGRTDFYPELGCCYFHCDKYTGFSESNMGGYNH